MKKLFPLLFLLLAFPVLAGIKVGADDVIGNWISATGEGKVQIFKSGEYYYGKITWLKTPNDPSTGKPKLDAKNPDESKRAQALIGLIILKSFVYKDNEWTDGTVYDPKSGKEYNCVMSMSDNNTLNIRGYIGMSALGRTETWKRTTN